MTDSSMSPELQRRCEDLRAARDAQLPSTIMDKLSPVDAPLVPATLYHDPDLVTKRQQQIVSTDAVGLAEAIAIKHYTSLEVVEAFIIAACAAHKGTNCLTWLFADEAYERARWLDAELERTGRVVGPLHGVPISVKDFIAVKGIPQSTGHIASAGFVPDHDAALVRIFRQAGAVFYAKTTQPQSVMHLETSSHIYGVSCSAHNSRLTCGGSSGGEGALVGCRGSPLGITTDVGGSTRSPAANNGLWGFKPSTKRVPRSGLYGVPSTARIAGAVGPIAHSLRDMALFFQVAFAGQPWRSESALVNIPWRPVDASGKGLGFDGWSGAGGKLRVGIMWSDGHVRPVKPILRGLEAVSRALKQSGLAEVQDIEPLGFTESSELTFQMYYPDGLESLLGALGDEPMLPLTEFITEGRRALSVSEIHALIARRNALRQRFLDHFNAHNLDVILCPASPAPAQALGTTKYWSYTSMFNLLDWPAAVIPTGLSVNETDVEPYPTPNNDDERHLAETYSAREAAGSPIGLQVTAPRWQDERLMAALETFNRVLPVSTPQTNGYH